MQRLFPFLEQPKAHSLEIELPSIVSNLESGELDLNSAVAVNDTVKVRKYNSSVFHCILVQDIIATLGVRLGPALKLMSAAMIIKSKKAPQQQRGGGKNN